MPKPPPLLHQRHMCVKTCRYGPMLYNATDKFVGRSLDLYGEFSEGEAEFFHQILRPGMVAIDAGANIGCHTVVMARRVEPNGLVIAIEPQRVIFQTLCANVAMNALDNVHTVHAAAGAVADEIIVPSIDYSAGGNFGGVELGGHENGERVGVVAIDSLPLPSCHLIKIDVEGMENEALEGAKETLEKFKPALYVENDRVERSAELIERLLKADYRLFWHRPFLYNPENFFANGENVFPNIVSSNMVGMPKSSGINVEGLREITSPEDRPESPAN